MYQKTKPEPQKILQWLYFLNTKENLEKYDKTSLSRKSKGEAGRDKHLYL